MTLSRRGLLTGVGGTALLGLTGSLGLISPGPAAQTGALLTSARPLPRPFTAPLPVPPVARPVRPGEYELTARQAQASILPGTRTRILGYDGVFPGPTIRARRDEPVTLRLRNELGLPTVLHLHGGHTPPEHDGYPTDLLLPTSGQQQPTHDMPGRISRGTRDYRFPLRQRGSTLWYHDHTMDFTGPNVYFGLAGMFLLSDAEEDALGLPDAERELPLVLCDRAFDGDGALRYPALSARRLEPGVQERYMGGVLGDVLLVNGAPWPQHAVSAGWHRLRLLNASNARRYELSLRSPRGPLPFVQIGTDGGLLTRPVRRNSITLAAAERVDVLVNFGDVPIGTDVTMHNGLGEAGTTNVMRFHVARKESDDFRVPERLSTIEALRRDEVAAVRDIAFRLGRPVGGAHSGGHGGEQGALRWMVNDQAFDPEVSVARPKLGDVELWRFSTDLHHPVHLHLVQMQVVARNGGRPTTGDLGWKDTVDLLPGQTVEALMRFDGFRGRYVFHCHNLEHEDMAMMANFTIQ